MKSAILSSKNVSSYLKVLRTIPNSFITEVYKVGWRDLIDSLYDIDYRRYSFRIASLAISVR